MRQSAAEIISQGMKWIRENREAWQWLLNAVRADVRAGNGEGLRICYYVENLRHERRVSVPNAIRPYLARRIEREVEGARFASAKSKVYGLLDRDE